MPNTVNLLLMHWRMCSKTHSQFVLTDYKTLQILYILCFMFFFLSPQAYDKVLYTLGTLTDNSNYQGGRTVMAICYI